MASIGPSSLGAKGCVAVAQGAKAVVWRLLKMKGRQYDKTHLVSWWAVFPKGPAAARQRGIWPCANARAKGCVAVAQGGEGRGVAPFEQEGVPLL